MWAMLVANSGDLLCTFEYSMRVFSGRKMHFKGINVSLPREFPRNMLSAFIDEFAQGCLQCIACNFATTVPAVEYFDRAIAGNGQI